MERPSYGTPSGFVQWRCIRQGLQPAREGDRLTIRATTDTSLGIVAKPRRESRPSARRAPGFPTEQSQLARLVRRRVFSEEEPAEQCELTLCHCVELPRSRWNCPALVLR